MGHHHPALDLPEVLFQIGGNLETLADVVACSLVCKSFRASFEPYTWMNIQIGMFPPREKQRLHRQEPLGRLISINPIYGEMRPKKLGHTLRQGRILRGLQRIAPWIRSLAIRTHSFPPQLKLGDQCTRIKTLYITGAPNNKRFDEAYWNDCEVLLKQNSASLRSLSLVGWGSRTNGPNSVQPLWRPLLACAQHTNLSTLRIRTCGMTEQGWEVLLGIGQRLEILELRDVDMEDLTTRFSGFHPAGAMNQGNNSPSQVVYDLVIGKQVSSEPTNASANGTFADRSTPTIATTATVRFPKLRELTLVALDINCEHQLKQFIVHCPLLQTLIWRAKISQSCWKQFCDYLAARIWPCLDWIEINCQQRQIDDQDHALLLQSASRPFRLLDVNISYLEQRTFNLYRERGHFTTLTKLNLTPSSSPLVMRPPGSSITTMVSKQVQEVLESCPMLEQIAAAVITAQDIIQGKPWVCRRLKIFEVMINMEPSGENHAQEGKRTGIKYSKDYRTRCHQVFEQLGQLKQLTVLNMCLRDERPNCIPSSSFTELPLSLRMGLGHLSTLKKLEMIGYEGPWEIRLVDMEWMLQHWKNLRDIVGGRLFMKCCKTLEGVPDDRSRLVMETLKAREIRLDFRVLCEKVDIVYCSDSESEIEVDDGAK
ncbi:hypothetical protein B0O80DRAFT_427576 [Mortierella sp. GBAus27b]|nr:hypothetical protein B0O80DRAFT_427576 [Mortierella sp. GBAus27b]